MISNPSTFENWLTDRSNIGLEISLCRVVGRLWCCVLVGFGQVACSTHVTSVRNVRLGTDSFFVVRNRNAYKCRIRSYYVFRMLYLFVIIWWCNLMSYCLSFPEYWLTCSNYKGGFTLIPGYCNILTCLYRYTCIS